MTKSEKIQQLITDLYWEFDRMSSSGQETLEELATLVGVPTEAEVASSLGEIHE